MSSNRGVGTQNTGTGTGTSSSTYELHGITFSKSSNNKIRIQVPPGQNTVEFTLGEWNQVLMGLGLDQYLENPQGFTGSSQS